MYQWRFDGTNIAGATNVTYTRYDAQASNIGAYSVVVSNAVGSAFSANAFLSITPPPPGTLWQKSFGGQGYDVLRSLQPTTDGGFILGGESSSDVSGNKTSTNYGATDYWVIKLDASGNKIWENSFGGSGADLLYKLQQTSDGGYILGGASDSGVSGNKTSPNHGLNDYWVARLDGNGNKVWENSFGGSGSDSLNSLQQTSDGGFILGGYSGSPVSGNKTSTNWGSADYWVIKLDAGGNKIWEKSFGGLNSDELYTLQQSTDGGYILGGTSNSGISGNKTSTNYGSYDYWIIKLDSNGSNLWENSFGGASNDSLLSLQQTTDGGFILGGYSDSYPSGNKTSGTDYGSYDYWVVKIDGSGNKIWDKSFGRSERDYLNSLQQTSDGGYILGGGSDLSFSGNMTSPNYGSSDYWVIKLDGSGNKIWEQSFGGESFDYLYSLQQTDDGSYILGGKSESDVSGYKTSPNFGNADIWVIKLVEGFPFINFKKEPQSQAIYFGDSATISVAATGEYPLMYQWRFNGTNIAGATNAAFTVENAQASNAGEYSVVVSNAVGSTISVKAVLHISTPPPAIAWQNSFGGSTWDYLSSLRQTADGGYILGGYSNSGISGSKTSTNYGYSDYWVIKLDQSGDKLWETSFGGSSSDSLQSLQQTSDGGSILGGYSNSDISGNKSSPRLGYYDYWVVKLDSSGNKLWENSYGGSNGDYLLSLQKTSDGGYVLGGYSNSEISGNKTSPLFGNEDYWVVKIDAGGKRLWDKSFGGLDWDSLSSLQQTSDGGYILGGDSRSEISGNKTSAHYGYQDYWVVKLDDNGNKLWDKSFGGSDNDHLSSLQQTSDGGYILGGYSISEISGNKTSTHYGNQDYWVIKLDAGGNKLWEKTFGGSDWDSLHSLQQTSDGGYLLGGISHSDFLSGNKTSPNYGRSDYWVIKLDDGGNKLWEQSFGTSSDESLFSLQQTSDGRYILGGRSSGGLSGNKASAYYGSDDYWVIKLDGDVLLSVHFLPGDALSLRWPFPSTGWILQQNSDLSTTNWIPSPFPISDEGAHRAITISPATNRLFFRLTR